MSYCRRGPDSDIYMFPMYDEAGNLSIVCYEEIMKRSKRMKHAKNLDSSRTCETCKFNSLGCETAAEAYLSYENMIKEGDDSEYVHCVTIMANNCKGYTKYNRCWWEEGGKCYCEGRNFIRGADGISTLLSQCPCDCYQDKVEKLATVIPRNKLTVISDCYPCFGNFKPNEAPCESSWGRDEVCHTCFVLFRGRKDKEVKIVMAGKRGNISGE